ncbi:MAG: lipopolysaccharide assembly protein LapB [Lautropia sp.]|nr:MAG: lipopolysaccharide assembly protein LapB [Pseudomonadota bacterium]MBC6958292.1 lipopolysaccharide assembly protein LapB [Lautropia sp.]MCL4701465.1 lipopolysaccharide assembly protein LapB [Burkholderiaceae bacterium]MCZ2413949.1 lipopolysaccharide assembly protein LapB [Burkholderiales bacterium]MDL1907262.1 lipopolysaccharide assembly protein LapB [Betaproteobacteria bacterium PRO1]
MLEFEAWWLLAIPLFFVLGWFAARYEAALGNNGRRGDGGGLPDAYFRGLNFLLNEQSDKAVDAFIDVVRLDPETVDLHYALGNLFRRRGETDRAIRVHLNLVERRDLDASQREHALFELGQDYLKAGLLDRAEDAFNRLEGTRYGASALHHRLEIAQMVRDWPLAIELAERLQRDRGENRARDVAHFRCELAARALASDAESRFEVARRELEQAARVDPAHPRPQLLLGEVAAAEGDHAAAIDAWRRVERNSPEYLGLVAPGWLAAFAALGRSDEGIEALEAVDREHPSIDTFSALAAARAERDGGPAAVAWAEQALQVAPSLLGLEKLLAMKAALRRDGEQAEVELAQRLIQAQARRLSRYVCGHCGFKARQFYWQCPGCNRWDTYAPRRSEELERG